MLKKKWEVESLPFKLPSKTSITTMQIYKKIKT